MHHFSLARFGLALFALLLLGACEGGSNAFSGNGSGGGDGGGSIPAGTVDTLDLVVASAQVLEGSPLTSSEANTVALSVTVTDENGVAVAGVPITFQVVSGPGVIRVIEPVTNVSGTALASLGPAGDANPGDVVMLQASTLVGGMTLASAVRSVTIVAGGDQVELFSDTARIDDTEQALITATVRDLSGQLLPNVPVSFFASSGQIGAGRVSTDANGVAQTTVSAGSNSAPRAINVTAILPSGLSASTSVAVSRPLEGIQLLSSSTQLRADADTPAEGVTLTAIVLDEDGSPIPNVEVGFDIVAPVAAGLIVVNNRTTGADGIANAVLTTGSDPSARQISIQARAIGRPDTSQVLTIEVLATSDISIGSTGGSGGFDSGDLAVVAPNISFGGSSVLRLEFAVDGGTRIASGEALASQGVEVNSVRFQSECQRVGDAVIDVASSGSNAVTDIGDGVLTALYTASGCEGTDTITVTADLSVTSPNTVIPENRILTATGTINVQPAVLGSLSFLSVTPNLLGLRGAGFAETAIATFQLTSQNGAPVANRQVSFELSSTVGGIALDALSDTTDLDGQVTAIVRSGTARTVAQVTARTVDANNGNQELISQSRQLIVSSNLPDDGSFTLTADRLNVRAFNIDGVLVNVTARVADRYNNPPPVGTVINFTTERDAGTIFEDPASAAAAGADPNAPLAGGCRTSPQGDCVVNFVSQGERPTDGRTTILAYLTGEESFIDANGDGQFTVGETVFQLAEAFVDADEDGCFDTGEMDNCENAPEMDVDAPDELIDFNGDGIFNGPDTVFNGITCDALRCESDQLLNINDDLVIVWSTGDPVIELLEISDEPLTANNEFGDDPATAGVVEERTGVNGVIDFIGEKDVVNLIFQIRDTIQQPLPVGTTYTIASQIATPVTLPTVTQENTNSDVPGNHLRRYALRGPDAMECDSGALTMTVAVPAEGPFAASTFAFSFAERYFPTPAPTLTAPVESLFEGGNPLTITVSLVCPNFEDVVVVLDKITPFEVEATLKCPMGSMATCSQSGDGVEITIPSGQLSSSFTAKIEQNAVENNEGDLTIFATGFEVDSGGAVNLENANLTLTITDDEMAKR